MLLQAKATVRRWSKNKRHAGARTINHLVPDTLETYFLLRGQAGNHAVTIDQLLRALGGQTA